MPTMTDPSTALASFQQAYNHGMVRVEVGRLDSSIFVHPDQPNGKMRLSYVSLNGKTVTALAMYVLGEPIDGVQCFDLGYAVPERFRGQGLAKKIVLTSIAEMTNGFSQTPLKRFRVHAVVGTENVASQHVAAAVITNSPESIIDSVSGLPALFYSRLVG